MASQIKVRAGRAMDYRHWTLLASVIGGSIVLAIGHARGDVSPALTFLAVQGLVLGLWFWLTRPSTSVGHLSHAVAQAEASIDDVIVYWRPG